MLKKILIILPFIISCGTGASDSLFSPAGNNNIDAGQDPGINFGHWDAGVCYCPEPYSNVELTSLSEAQINCVCEDAGGSSGGSSGGTSSSGGSSGGGSSGSSSGGSLIDAGVLIDGGIPEDCDCDCDCDSDSGC